MSRHFDQQNNRVNYGEALTPPQGYELDFAVGLTYSLDLEAFLSVPVFLSCAEQTDEISNNPYLMLESIRKNSEKIALFCNGDGIKYVNPRNAAFFAMIENCVHPISMPEKSYFHPKLWVIRYKRAEFPDKLRVIVLSRNLTFDQSMDIAVTLEAEATDIYNEAHQGLADMIAFVAKKTTPKKKRDKIIDLADSIMYAGAFDCGSDFESYRFMPFRIDGHRKESDIFFSWAYDTIVVSPFLTDSVVLKMAENAKSKKLITRISSASKKAFEAFDEVWIPKEEILNNEILEEGNEDGAFRDLHAKIVYRTTSAGNYLYLGSLNTTANAFYKNIEFMLELKYKPYHGGYWTVHDDLLPNDNNVFHKLDTPNLEANTETDDMLSDFSDVVRAIESAKVAADGDAYQITIRSKRLTNSVEIAPLMRPAAVKRLEEETVFDGIQLQELSCFYIVKRDDQKRIVKISTKGIPDDRNNVLFNQILKDKPGFFAYLLFLLSGGRSEAAFQQEDFRRLLSNGKNSKTLRSMAPSLYEQLLRAASESTDTITNISDVINKVDPDMIDSSLKELIELIKSSVRKRR